jgi:choline kinase
MKPTLLILAAGMGSRYGGLKQADSIGPNGEAIIEYSVFDAIRAGFGKVVFVIRKSIEADFKEKLVKSKSNMLFKKLILQSKAFLNFLTAKSLGAQVTRCSWHNT